MIYFLRIVRKRVGEISKKKKQKQITLRDLICLIILTILVGYYSYVNGGQLPQTQVDEDGIVQEISSFDLSSIPEYDGTPYVYLNDNKPEFSEEDYNRGVFEEYSELDSLGRCGIAFANICTEIMPKTEREGIGSVKPSGWKTARYDDLVDGKYLYNRCHLIGYQLAGENANKKNLITGTRYLNVTGMLPFENEVADYIKNNNENHVLYRVTPIFEGNNLVANGVQMEACSIEDDGEGICFNVFVYNVQPGIKIDYATGDSSRI